MSIENSIVFREGNFYTANKQTFGNVSLDDFFAPLPVFLEVESSSDSNIKEHRWDFGDGRTAIGSAVANVYETPGSYTVTVESINESNESSISTKVITVQERQGNTYYVSPNGNDNNNGLSENSAWRTATKAFSLLNGNFSPGDKVLFRRGGTYNVSGTLVVSSSFKYGLLFGAYGDKKLHTPIIKYNGGASGDRASLFNSTQIGPTHLVFQDLEFDLTSSTGSRASLWYSQGEKNNILFLRIRVKNFIQGINAPHGFNNLRFEGLFIVDSEFSNSSNNNTAVGEHVNYRGSKLAIINSKFDLSSASFINTSYTDAAYIYNNSFSRHAYDFAAIRFSNSTSPNDFNFSSKNINIVRNFLSGWIPNGQEYNLYTNRLISIDSTTTSVNQKFENIFIYENTFSDARRMLIISSTENAIIRKNIFHSNVDMPLDCVIFGSLPNMDTFPLTNILFEKNELHSTNLSQNMGGSVAFITVKQYTPDATKFHNVKIIDNNIYRYNNLFVNVESLSTNQKNFLEFNNNKYYTLEANLSSNLFRYGTTNYSFSNWKSVFSLDSNSSVRNINHNPRQPQIHFGKLSDDGEFELRYKDTKDNSGSGLDKITLWARKENGAWFETEENSGSLSSGTFNYNIEPGHYSNYKFIVRATDNNGNISRFKEMTSSWNSNIKTITPGDVDIPYFAPPSVSANIEVTEDHYFTTNRNNFYGGATLTEFYAPLPVFFSGYTSTADFEIAEYRWDFGDGSPYRYGFNTAHIFEEGEYTVTLRVTDVNGVYDESTIDIKALSRDGVTYYVDSDIGDDSNDGLSPATAWKTANYAFEGLRRTGGGSNQQGRYFAGDQILFKRGQEFDVWERSNLDHSKRYGVLFASYGDPEDSKPKIVFTGSSPITVIEKTGNGFAFLVFRDLEFDLTNTQNQVTAGLIFTTGNMTNLAFYNCDVKNFSGGVVLSHGNISEHALSGAFIIKCTFYNGCVGGGSSMVFPVAKNVAIIDNHFDYSRNHIVYGAYIGDGIITGNTFKRSAGGRHALRVNGPSFSYPSKNVWIEDNYFYGWIDPTVGGTGLNGERYNWCVLHLGPNAHNPQAIENVVVKNNTITDGEQLTSISCYDNLIFENNLLYTNSTYAASTVRYGFLHHFDRKPNRNISFAKNQLFIRTTSSNDRYGIGIVSFRDAVPTMGSQTYQGRTEHDQLYFRDNIIFSQNSLPFVVLGGGNELLNEISSDKNRFFPNAPGNLFRTTIRTWAQNHEGGWYPVDVPSNYTLEQWRAHSGEDFNSNMNDITKLPNSPSIVDVNVVGHGVFEVLYSGATDNSGFGISKVCLWMKKDNGSWVKTECYSQTTGSGAMIHKVQDNAYGNYYFWVQAEDNEGNVSLPPEEIAFWDTQAIPDIETLKEFGDAQLEYTSSSYSGGTPPSQVVITTNGGQNFSTNTSNVTLNGTCSSDTHLIRVNGSTTGVTYTSGNTNWSYTGTLTPGNNNISIVASNFEGDTSTPATITIEFVTDIPTVSITSDGGSGAGIGYRTNNSNVTISGTCSSNTNVIKVNNSTSGVTYTSGNTEWSYSGALIEGNNTFTVIAETSVGNVSSPKSITIELDTTGPNPVTINTNNGANFTTGSQTLILNGSASIGTHSIKVNDSTTGVVYNQITRNWSFNTQLSEGQNTFNIVAFDDLENESTPVTIIVTYEIAETEITPPPPGLIHYFQFENSPSNGGIIDYVNPGNLSYTWNGPVSLVEGKFGNAYNFNHSNISLGNIDIPGTTMTLAAWVYPTSWAEWGRDGRILCKGTSMAINDHWWAISTVRIDDNTTGARLRLKTSPQGSTITLISSGANIPLNQWTHIAATYDGNVARIYVNGILRGEMNRVGSIVEDPNIPVMIGMQPVTNNKPWIGRIDEVRIYNIALDSSQINTLLSPPEFEPQLDITPPTPGELSVESNSVSTSVINLNYNGAFDNEGGSGLFKVELWVKQGNGNWENSGVFGTGSSGNLIYIAPSENVYYFDLVAEDNAGNRSPLPSGNGQVSVTFEVPVAPPPPPPPQDTTPPYKGNLFGPSSSTEPTVTLTYSGAVDEDGGSGLRRVMLFVRRSDTDWAFSGLEKTTSSGDFVYTFQPISGAFYFDLVAEDNAGNRSPLPTGNGQLTIVHHLPVEEGLIKYFSFDSLEDDEVEDFVSKTMYPATDTTLVDGVVGSGLEFNGTTSDVDLGTMDIVGPGLTLSAWIKPYSLSAPWYDARIISKATDLVDTAHWWALTPFRNSGETENRIRLRLKTSEDTYTLISEIGDIQLNEWTHVAGTYDGSTMKVFINGDLVGSMSASGLIAQDNTVPALIGRQPNRTDTSWNGAIDDVRIYNYAISQEELEGISTLSSTGQDPGDEIIDTEPPENAVINVFIYDAESPNWHFTFDPPNDNLSGVDYVDLYYKIDSGNWLYSGLRTPVPDVGHNPVVLGFLFSASVPGTYYFETVTVDKAGNSTPIPTSGTGQLSLSFSPPPPPPPPVQDTTPPTIGSVSSPESVETNLIPISYTDAVDNEGGSGLFRVQLFRKRNNGPWVYTHQFLTTKDGTFNFVPPEPSIYHFYVVAVDNAGNQSGVPVGNGQTTTSYIIPPPEPEIDTTPTIELNGSSTMTIEYGNPFNDPGAKATNFDGSPLSIVKSGVVDIFARGSAFTITYTANNGIESASVTRQVTVEDTIPPTITLNNPEYTNVESGEEYIEYGASAFDPVDGEVDVVISGSVNTTVPGKEFVITYTAIDASGNEASITRTVMVVDTIAPEKGIVFLNKGYRITNEAPIVVQYTGVKDNENGSGIKKVELWYKYNSESWKFSGLVSTSYPDGIFEFYPENSGVYYFDIVVVDNFNNKTPTPMKFEELSETDPEFNYLPISLEYIKIPKYFDGLTNLTGKIGEKLLYIVPPDEVHMHVHANKILIRIRESEPGDFSEEDFNIISPKIGDIVRMNGRIFIFHGNYWLPMGGINSNYIYYDGSAAPFDKPINGEYDNVDNNPAIDYTTVYSQYKEITYDKIAEVRHTKDHVIKEIVDGDEVETTRESLLDLRKATFTKNYGVFDDFGNYSGWGSPPGTTDFTCLFSDILNSIRFINDRFYNEIKNFKLISDEGELLQSMFLDLEDYLKRAPTITEIPVAYISLGIDLYDKIKPVIDFFKPYRARVREFLVEYKIEDMLSDSQLQLDDISKKIKQTMVDVGEWSLYNYELGFVKDNLDMLIYTDLYTVNDNYYDDIEYMINNISKDFYNYYDDKLDDDSKHIFVDYGNFSLDEGMVVDRDIESDSVLFEIIFNSNLFDTFGEYTDNIDYFDPFIIGVRESFYESIFDITESNNRIVKDSFVEDHIKRLILVDNYNSGVFIDGTPMYDSLEIEVIPV